MNFFRSMTMRALGARVLSTMASIDDDGVDMFVWIKLEIGGTDDWVENFGEVKAAD